MKQLQRILHVEDDDDITQLVRLSLETLGGFDLLQCASGREALERAAAYGPDLIVIDYMMPDMNGPATLRALRENPVLRDVPAIFMTARDMPESEAGELGAVVLGTIAKPFDAMALPDQVRAMWQRHAA